MDGCREAAGHRGRADGKDRRLYSYKGRPLYEWLDRALRINSLSPEESAVAYHYAQGLDNAQSTRRRAGRV
jgi:hypothetical protein